MNPKTTLPFAVLLLVLASGCRPAGPRHVYVRDSTPVFAYHDATIVEPSRLPPTGREPARVYPAQPAPEGTQTPGAALPGFAIIAEPASAMPEQDEALANAIRQSMERDPALITALSDVTVTVNNGRVTLRGGVRSQSDFENLAARIRNTPGVTIVENHLHLRPVP
jgi:hypothetical protein